MKPNSDNKSTTSKDSQLFALLTGCFYVLFTLWPDSHSQMVALPGVVLWQIGLLCPILWLLWLIWQRKQVRGLGLRLDWLVGWIVLGLIVSTIFAEYPNQAVWYSWSVFGFIAAIYALNYYLDRPQSRYQLLITQGYLNLAFIVVSLGLWTTQTLIPELSRLEQLKQYGVNLTYDFSILELRNWAPIGHQNYVAGYLLLAIPLLVGLSILQTGKQRWLWLAGVGLGLLDLYTTSSRGGWLGLLVLCIVGVAILLFRSSLPRLWLVLGGVGSIALLCSIVLLNNRLRNLILAVTRGDGGGELGFRVINNIIGWRMGSRDPMSGIGLGGVPILYQKYRPIWAGQESELVYQLHSTPAQLWGEMGLWGIVAFLAAIAFPIYLLLRRKGKINLDRSDFILLWSICGGMLAYTIISLTDYQLDNISISGTLVIYLACLVSIFRVSSAPVLPSKYSSKIALAGLSVTVAAIVWLVPVHLAWQFADRGFNSLLKDNVNSFVKNLTKAQQLAPWQPYYPYQLGWNLGDLALKTGNPQQQQKLLQESITWLEKGNKVSPYQEFGRSNLGWLLLSKNPKAATQEFARSAQLIPAKRGVFYRLGLGLWARGQRDWAIEAMTLEVLRNPMFISSPIWNSSGLQQLYPQVIARSLTQYSNLLKQYPQSGSFNTYLHQCRGGLYWWLGDLTAARKDIEVYGTPLSKFIVDLAREKNYEERLSQMPRSPAKLAIKAWLDPSDRQSLLREAWTIATRTALPATIEQELLAGMEKSSSFEQWLRENAPVSQYRRQRLGFGVNSRHFGGAEPLDFWIVSDNVAMTTWFVELLPTVGYFPQLDLALRSQQIAIIDRILSNVGNSF